MKKRLVASLLCAAMTASMVIGCGSQTNSDSQETSSSQKETEESADLANDAEMEDFEADLLILGSSTWGLGELQDDWLSGIAMLDSLDLTGRKVAVFGLGDQNGFPDTFADAMGILAEKAEERGAAIIGETSSAGYAYSISAAEKDGRFRGLALDDNNEPEKTPDRIGRWVEQLKAALA